MSSSKNKFMELREEEVQETNVTRSSPGNTSPSVIVSNGMVALKQMDAASIDTLAKALIHEVAEGVRAEDQLFAMGQKISLLGESIVNNVKPYVYGKTYCQKGDTYTIDGVELTPSALGTKYDYSSCQDNEWNALNEQFNAIKKAKEDREKFLKTIKGKMEIYNSDTAELNTVYEPIKTETQGYKSKVR